MTFLTRFLILMMSVLLVTNCARMASVQNRNNRYLSAKSVAPLKIPPGISTDAFQNTYPVPNRNDSDSAKSVSLIPPGL